MADHKLSDNLPLIAGVTETAQSDPGLRLASMMSGRLPQTSRDRISAAMSELEAAFELENDENTRVRVGAALSMLRRGSKSSKDRE